MSLLERTEVKAGESIRAGHEFEIPAHLSPSTSPGAKTLPRCEWTLENVTKSANGRAYPGQRPLRVYGSAETARSGSGSP